MSRIDFMEELERLLSDIPIEERTEALQYYNDYFEDAGEDQEEQIIKELGSPTRIAGIIKADLNTNGSDHETRGYFTEKGYEDTIYQDEKHEIVNAAKQGQQRQDYSRQGYGNTSRANGTGNSTGSAWSGNSTGSAWTGNSTGSAGAGAGTGQGGGSNQSQLNSGTKLLLIILVAIFAIPVGIPVVFSVLGVVFGIGMSILGITIGFGIAGVVMIAVGIGLFVIGLMQLNIPFVLLALCGSGLLVFGLGLLFLITSVLLGKLLPVLIRGFVNLCRLPFKNRSVAA